MAQNFDSNSQNFIDFAENSSIEPEMIHYKVELSAVNQNRE